MSSNSLLPVPFPSLLVVMRWSSGLENSISLFHYSVFGARELERILYWVETICYYYKLSTLRKVSQSGDHHNAFRSYDSVRSMYNKLIAWMNHGGKIYWCCVVFFKLKTSGFQRIYDISWNILLHLNSVSIYAAIIFKVLLCGPILLGYLVYPAVCISLIHWDAGRHISSGILE